MGFVNEYHEEHYKLWMWLSEHPNKCKDDYFKKFNKEHVRNSCYACEQMRKIRNLNCINNIKICRDVNCGDICPLDWGMNYKGKRCTCTMSNTLFSYWDMPYLSLDIKGEYARKIADMKWLIEQEIIDISKMTGNLLVKDDKDNIREGNHWKEVIHQFTPIPSKRMLKKENPNTIENFNIHELINSLDEISEHHKKIIEIIKKSIKEDDKI